MQANSYTKSIVYLHKIFCVKQKIQAAFKRWLSDQIPFKILESIYGMTFDKTSQYTFFLSLKTLQFLRKISGDMLISSL